MTSSIETKRMILARFVEFDVTLTNTLLWQPDVRFSKKNLFLLKNSRKINFSNYLLNFTFSTIFLVNNGHRAIKVHVHVNKVQYCRAGHIFCKGAIHNWRQRQFYSNGMIMDNTKAFPWSRVGLYTAGDRRRVTSHLAINHYIFNNLSLPSMLYNIITIV